MADTPTKTCFVISPIGDEGTPQRKRSDDVLDYIIAPALQQRDYNVVRADKTSKPGMITTEIFQHLLNDELVIADLTDQNPNVFYELAIRHASQKPVIQFILDDQSIPFDVSHSRTIFYKYPDVASMFQLQQEILKQIEVIEGDPQAFDNPLTMAAVLQGIRQSDEPLAKGITEVLGAVVDLRREIQMLGKRQHELSATPFHQISLPEFDIESTDDPRVFLLREYRGAVRDLDFAARRLEHQTQNAKSNPDEERSQHRLLMMERRMKARQRRVSELAQLLSGLGIPLSD